MAKKKLPEPYDVVFMRKRITKMETYISEQQKLPKAERNQNRVDQYRINTTTLRKWCRDRMAIEPQLAKEREQRKLQSLRGQHVNNPTKFIFSLFGKTAEFDMISKVNAEYMHGIGSDFGRFGTSVMGLIDDYEEVDGKRVINKFSPLSVEIIPNSDNDWPGIHWPITRFPKHPITLEQAANITKRNPPGSGFRSLQEIYKQMIDELGYKKPMFELPDSFKEAMINSRDRILKGFDALGSAASKAGGRFRDLILLALSIEQNHCTWEPLDEDVWDELEYYIQTREVPVYCNGTVVNTIRMNKYFLERIEKNQNIRITGIKQSNPFVDHTDNTTTHTITLTCENFNQIIDGE